MIPFEFRKLDDGTWQRRKLKSNQWETLRIETDEVSRREKYRQRDGTIVTQSVYGNRWIWD